MKKFTFDNIEILWTLILVPLFFVIFALLRNRRKNQLKKLGKNDIVKSLMLENSNFRPWLKFSILMLSLSLLIIAAARPSFVSETKVAANENNEIIIALDISNSMLAKSQQSNLSRLILAKNAISNLIDNLHNEKAGMVVFAGKAVMQIPITQDYSAFKLILRSIDPTYISAQGTNLADAINLSINAFTPNKDNQKSIIIISDGEDHEGDINASIEKAKQAGIKVYTVGIGSTRGEPIYLNGQVMKDQTGNIVMSKLNEDVLRQIANGTDAKYINLSSNSKALQDIYKLSNNTDGNGNMKINKKSDKFHYFVFPALLLLILDFFILMRTNRWIAKIDIFDKKLT